MYVEYIKCSFFLFRMNKNRIDGADQWHVFQKSKRVAVDVFAVSGSSDLSVNVIILSKECCSNALCSLPCIAKLTFFLYLLLHVNVYMWA